MIDDAAPAGGPVISVRRVSKTFHVQAITDKANRLGFGPARVTDRRAAVRDVSFEVAPSQTVGIIGPNGAGKTTLLRIVAGILQPDAGSVHVAGEVTPILGLQAGFAPDLSGVENVYLKGASLGMTDREIQTYVDRIVEFSGIGPAMNRPLRTYSSGMRMRLAFAITFLRTPEVLIVDETLAVGDETFRRRSMARIEEIKEAGATILLVSHGTHLLRGFCDRVMVMDDGELLVDGDPDAALDAYQRLVYAAPAERDAVRRAIRDGGAGSAADGAAAAALAVAEVAAAGGATVPGPAPVPDTGRTPAPGTPADTVVEPRTRHRPQGARINGIRFLAENGAETRRVPSGGTLAAECRTVFMEPARDVSLRLSIVTEAGLELGAVYLEPRGLAEPFVAAGRHVLFTGRLRLPLAAGRYLVSADLFGSVGPDRHWLHAMDGLSALHVTGADPRAEGPVNLLAT